MFGSSFKSRPYFSFYSLCYGLHAPHLCINWDTYMYLFIFLPLTAHRTYALCISMYRRTWKWETFFGRIYKRCGLWDMTYIVQTYQCPSWWLFWISYFFFLVTYDSGMGMGLDRVWLLQRIVFPAYFLVRWTRPIRYSISGRINYSEKRSHHCAFVCECAIFFDNVTAGSTRYASIDKYYVHVIQIIPAITEKCAAVAYILCTLQIYIVLFSATLGNLRFKHEIASLCHTKWLIKAFIIQKYIYDHSDKYLFVICIDSKIENPKRTKWVSN